MEGSNDVKWLRETNSPDPITFVSLAVVGREIKFAPCGRLDPQSHQKREYQTRAVF